VEEAAVQRVERDGGFDERGRGRELGRLGLGDKAGVEHVPVAAQNDGAVPEDLADAGAGPRDDLRGVARLGQLFGGDEVDDEARRVPGVVERKLGAGSVVAQDRRAVRRRRGRVAIGDEDLARPARPRGQFREARRVVQKVPVRAAIEAGLDGAGCCRGARRVRRRQGVEVL